MARTRVSPSIARRNFRAADLRSVKLDNYFQIYFSASDPLFRDGDGNGIPDVLDRNADTISRSKQFLQTVIELFNYGSNVVNLSGCILTDDPVTNKFVIPPGTEKADAAGSYRQARWVPWGLLGR